MIPANTATHAHDMCQIVILKTLGKEMVARTRRPYQPSNGKQSHIRSFGAANIQVGHDLSAFSSLQIASSSFQYMSA